MTNLAAVCLTVAVCFAVGSCSWMNIEQSRARYEAQQKCMDVGGTWNAFFSQCDRPQK